MAAAARVLPRNWDGRRLLRFLAGLAMLALAFTMPAPGPDAGSALPAPSARALRTQLEITATAKTSLDISGKFGNVGVDKGAVATVAAVSPASASASAASPATAGIETSADISEKFEYVEPSQTATLVLPATTLVLAGVALRISAQRAPPAV